eukprot:5996193-Pyramimonas_sp.AAC.1
MAAIVLVLRVAPIVLLVPRGPPYVPVTIAVVIAVALSGSVPIAVLLAPGPPPTPYAPVPVAVPVTVALVGTGPIAGPSGLAPCSAVVQFPRGEDPRPASLAPVFDRRAGAGRGAPSSCGRGSGPRVQGAVVSGSRRVH